MNRNFFYLNDGRVMVAEEELIFSFLLDKEFDNLRASYVSLNRRPLRNSFKLPPSKLKVLKLLAVDYIMRLYRLIRRQLLIMSNNHVYFFYD